jgi:hypothetical protein
MALQDELTALRRLMESINRLSASNAASIGKLATEQTALREELAKTRLIAERSIQMCNDLGTKLTRLLPLP